ncbi:PREDICTED: uncharacterized protein LOC106788669 isoform X1 [Polistes canadensis]|uniref:uncharacterized protein LOC106788669 isoform X1 n=1 Tax=Polistes canadensis TaxID=91411 RepID=UPI000718FC30|nr:PREDICTED: uncharacterized protein LOC106788669 isoform X1 [Polistes canadensis]XP_014607626.1 PREDICTED: uncharacterized protein LOC106788669 isoform X1 [Polistes canadensis]XP_014607636.1 PREDICTED: uncharacterized protein LOC106788669 isoform X1 [Polistes canadensis]
MSTVENSLHDQDPDYTIPISTNKNPEEVCEENARTTARKITEIIEKEFSQEIDTKQNEVLQIQERLHKALKTLHLLRYVIITDFYNRKQCQASQTRETQQTRIHPAIKQLIGKSPKRSHNDFAVPSTSTDPRFLNGYSYPSPKRATTTEHNVIKTENTTESSKECNTSMQFKSQSIQDNTPSQKKIPRYIPPKSGLPEPASPSRGVRHKVRKRIVIGNISKWIPQDWREDPASHKWTMYVQGSKEFPNIEDFVSKVRFFLHPSYKPNDVVEVSTVPFNLSRRGWGEFPLRVQLHFKNPINKPMDIIHNLKLDRTFTGLQTLGSETVVDVWIYTMDPNIFIQTEREICDSSKEEINSSNVNEEHKFDSMIIKTPQKSSTSIDSNTITVKSETNNLEVPNIDKLYDMKSQIQLDVIKSEPIDEVPQAMSFMTNDNTLTSKCNNNTKKLENMRFSVTHDHDYLNNSISNETNLFVENNITIKHSPDNSPIKKSINSTVEQSGNNTNLIKQFSNNQHCTFNANTEKLVETNKNTLCQMNFKSNLRPLQISIPPSFETTAGKHMLILQNNKRTSTEANNACPSKVDTAKSAKNYNKINTNNCLSYGNSKTSILIPRGTSLLKKQVKQTGKTTTNNKNDNKYAILEIKPSNSLLLNLNSNVPALKIADNASYNTVNLYNKNSSHLETSSLQKDQTFTKPINHNGKIGKSRIILGKDKWRLHSKEDLYKKDLKTIETAKITDVEGLLRFIIRRIPIVTPHASDPDYKRLHPYACTTEKEYFNHNVGKRAAYEWWRAKTVRSFLRKKLTTEDKLWSVKEIILWARLYGYTPTRSCFGIDATTTTSGAKRLPCTEISATTSTCTEPIAFQKWLQTSYDASKNLTTDNDDSQEEEVDILTCQNPENNKTTQQNKIKFGCSNEVAKSNTISLNLEEELLPLHNFVCETTRNIGITLKPEEIFPNVLHCSASRVMIRAMECFVEDLVRTSLVKAWEKSNGKECPQTLSLDDVRSALMSREEFDIFTNEGLGSRYSLNTED